MLSFLRRTPPFRLGALASLFALGACAPPALSGADSAAGGPQIEIVFPQSRQDITICPNFVVAVNIEGLDVVDFTENETNATGQGHWHLYIGDAYQNAFSDPWAQASVPEGTEGNVIIRARISANDHTETDLEAAAEIVVGKTDCVGGGAAATPGGGY
jgi:hypothetical protein